MARRKVYFSARLDFPSSPLSAPGSPRMDLPGIQCFNPLSWQTTLYLFVIYPGKVKHEPEIMTTWISNIGTAFFSPLLMLRLNCDNLFCTYFLQRCLLGAHNDFFLQNNCSKEHLLPRNFWFSRKAKHFWITDLFVYDNWNFSTKLSCDFRSLWCSHFITKILLTKTHSNFFLLHVPTKRGHFIRPKSNSLFSLLLYPFWNYWWSLQSISSHRCDLFTNHIFPSRKIDR